jgi:hypothetical protein
MRPLANGQARRGRAPNFPVQRLAQCLEVGGAKARRAAARRQSSTIALCSLARSTSVRSSSSGTTATARRLSHSASFPVMPTTSVSSSTTSLSGDGRRTRPLSFNRPTRSARRATRSFARLGVTSMLAIRASRLRRSASISLATSVIAAVTGPCGRRAAARCAIATPAHAAA